MPTAARPTTWMDWSTIFRDVIPREWPKRLFGAGSQSYKDLIALGESLALVRDMLSFMQNAVIPALDENYIFLTDWETAFDIKPKGTESERMDRVIAMFRQRGTMTQDLVKAIMCRAWGSNDPSVVSIISPAMTPAPQCAKHGAFLGANMHIYHTAQTAEPDDALIQDLIARVRPTWEYWTYGRYGKSDLAGPYAVYGPHANVGLYNRCVYG